MTTPSTDKTVPAEELNRRRRVFQLGDEVGDLMKSLAEKLAELQELGAQPERLRDELMDRLSRISFNEDGSYDTITRIGGSGIVSPMSSVISRLLEEAPKLRNPDGSIDKTQTAAIECHVLLRHAKEPLYGSLSLTFDGALRMMAPANLIDPSTRKETPKLMEHFFDIEDVVSIVVMREVASEKSRIVTI
jgi:hypothetical protein